MATVFGSASQKRLDSVALYFSAFLKIIDNVKTNRGEMNAYSCVQTWQAACVSTAEWTDRQWR